MVDTPTVSAISSQALLLMLNPLVNGWSTCTAKVTLTTPPSPGIVPRFHSSGLKASGSGLALLLVWLKQKNLVLRK